MAGLPQVFGILLLTLVDLLHLELLQMATGACICVGSPKLEPELLHVAVGDIITIRGWKDHG